MNDQDLKKAVIERNKKVMLDLNPMIIPPDFEDLPTEEESDYTPPPDNRGLFQKILDKFTK